MSTSFDWRNLCESVASAWPVWRFRDVGVVVGCSGGADSVALLRCLVDLVRQDSPRGPAQGLIVAAHYDHGFRGDESAGDAEFVRQLADQLDIPLEIARGTTQGVTQKCDEQSAREERRAFFRDVLRRRGARYLALGHSLDDNVETVLYRLMRGTGPTGIAGIAPFRPLSDCQQGSDFVVARPMLGVGRDEIRAALRSHGCPWREDTSNQSNAFRRNWIRNELLPLIGQQFPDAVAAIGRAIDGQRQWQAALEPEIDRWLERFLLRSDPLVIRRLDAEPSQEQHSGTHAGQQAITVEALRRIWHQQRWPLQAMGQTHWNRLFEMLSGFGTDAFTFPGAIEARRDDRSVTLIRRPSKSTRLSP